MGFASSDEDRLKRYDEDMHGTGGVVGPPGGDLGVRFVPSIGVHYRTQERPKPTEDTFPEESEPSNSELLRIICKNLRFDCADFGKQLVELCQSVNLVAILDEASALLHRWERILFKFDGLSKFDLTENSTHAECADSSLPEGGTDGADLAAYEVLITNKKSLSKVTKGLAKSGSQLSISLDNFKELLSHSPTCDLRHRDQNTVRRASDLVTLYERITALSHLIDEFSTHEFFDEVWNEYCDIHG